MKLPKECPACGCPFWEKSTSQTAECYSPWKDLTGEWHVGPSSETVAVRCAKCSWAFRYEKKRGKLAETDYYIKLCQLLKDWVPSDTLVRLFAWPEEVEVTHAEIDRVKGVLDLRLKVNLTPPEEGV